MYLVAQREALLGGLITGYKDTLQFVARTSPTDIAQLLTDCSRFMSFVSMTTVVPTISSRIPSLPVL
jgi:hypothetical protein